jgi:catechol 2,3-dioxygenase-like lactoylglutathione lyase family enzyme
VLLDAVRIGTDALDAAVADYARLLDGPGTRLAPGRHRFTLAQGAIELVDAGPPGIQALRFVAPAPPDVDFHGIAVEVAPAAPDLPADTALAIDHVVVRTAAPERAVALWRDALGLRLAFDRVFPARHLRLLFFRTNHMTLEYAAPDPPVTGDPGPDGFYGVSFRVPDLEAARARLLAGGVDVSAARPGNKAGTTVATVRSHTAGVPTLLIQHPPR